MAELQHVMRGIVLEATRFTPVAIPGKVMNPKFENQECPGLALAVTEPHRFETVKFGVALLCALHKIHPDEFAINQNGLARLSGTGWLYDMILAGDSAAAIWQRIEKDTQEFRRLREKYLLYEE
jgi:uncharacterized protein YbbC (DUF1343 family)